MGEIADALAPRLASDTYLVITSDHGEGLGERGLYGHARKIYDENVRIPLIVLGPGLGPGVVADPVSTVDVLPTLLDLARVSPPRGLDGTSLVPWLTDPAGAGSTRPVVTVSRFYGDQRPSVAVTEGRFKLLVDSDGSLSLFDLDADPGETADVAGAHSDVTARLLRLAEPRQAWRPGAATADGEEMDEQLRQDLEELGYLR